MRASFNCLLLFKGLLVPVSCIPDKIPHFVGRQKECEAVLDHLTNKDTRLVDIWGPPGFGKTSLAINVAHHLREMKIPVYFTSLRGMKSKDEIVSKLLRIFTDAKQALPSHWLIQRFQQLEKTFILILDNADDILESGDTELKEDFLRFTEEVLAHCSNIKLLFTTRERLDYLSHKLPIRQERVGALDKASSVSLVQSLLQCVSDNDCDCIVKECGQVPLAMRLMCGIMKEENVSLSELLEELKASTLVEVLDDESLPDDARLKTIINRSFGRLGSQERHAFVSLTVFTSFFGVQEATAVLDFKAARQTKKVLHSLQRKSLLDCSDDFESCTIHSLLRSFIDETRNANNAVQSAFNAAKLRFYDYHISSFEVANEKFLTGHSSEAFQVFFRQRDNILISLENGSKHDTLYPKVVNVLSKAEIFLRALQPNEPLLFNKLYSTTIEEAKKRKYRDDECNLLAAKSFGSLGGFYVERRNLDLALQAGVRNTESCPAKRLCYLGIHQLLRGKTDEGISSLKTSVDRLNGDCDEKVLKVLVYHVLTVCCRKKGDMEEASQFETLCSSESKSASFSPAVRNLFLRDVCSGEVTDFIMEQDVFFFVAVAELLPLLYSELQFGKQTEKEQSIMTQHLVGLHKVLLALFSKGVVPVRVLEACCNALYSLKCFKEAAEGFQILINELEKIQGSELNRIAENYFYRSSALTEMKDYKGADFCLKKSLDIRRQLLQEILDLKQSNKIVGELPSLISCLKMQKTLNGATAGPTDDIKALFEELKSALKSMENNNNAEHAEIATCYNHLGHCYFLLHDWNAAHELFERALKIDEEHVGDSDGKVSYLMNKGTACFNMNRNIEAGETFQRALNLRKLLGIEDHVDTAFIYQRLGENHLVLEEFSEALKAGHQSLQLRKKHLGDHILTAQSFSLTGAVYFKMGKYEAAREHAQHAANITKTLLGDHEETATAFDQLTTVSLKMGDYREALNACQEVGNIRLKLLGEHLDTAISFHQFGCICGKMDKFKEAAWSFRKASEMRLHLLGDHLDTALSCHCLGQAQLCYGDFSGAYKYLRTALRIRKKELGNHSETAATLELLDRAYVGLLSKSEENLK